MLTAAFATDLLQQIVNYLHVVFPTSVFEVGMSFWLLHFLIIAYFYLYVSCVCLISYEENEHVEKKVQVSKDQKKAQSQKDSHSKNRGGKKLN